MRLLTSNQKPTRVPTEKPGISHKANLLEQDKDISVKTPSTKLIASPGASTLFEQDKVPVKTASTKPIAPQVASLSLELKKVSSKAGSSKLFSPPVAKSSCQPVLPICQYGGYCNTDSDCYAGNYCRLDQLPYYTQCVPKPSTYKIFNCLPNYYGYDQQCSSDNDCCDPGAFCNKLGFRQCQQPAIGSPVCSNPSKFEINIDCILKSSTRPTFEPIVMPTFEFTVMPTITQVTPLIAPNSYLRLSRSLLANLSCRFASMEDIVIQIVIAMLVTTADWINCRTILNAFLNLRLTRSLIVCLTIMAMINNVPRITIVAILGHSVIS